MHYGGDTWSSVMSQKFASNRMQLESMAVSCVLNFDAQPTNQPAQFWSRASTEVSGTSFLSGNKLAKK